MPQQYVLHLKLLGALEIYIDTPPSFRFRTRKAQSLLIVLATTQKLWTRDELATLFWPETSSERARKNLRDILPTLRRHVNDYLQFGDENIALNPSSLIKCDVSYFSRVLEKPLHTVDTSVLTEALGLYRGEFLEGYSIAKISTEFEHWALRERERLQQLAVRGLAELCERQYAANEVEAALHTNQRRLKLVPWDEEAHRQQMLLLYQSGQHSAALAHFESCRQILIEELDAQPDPQTMALFKKIKASTPQSSQLDRVESHPLPAPKPKSIPHNLPRQLTGLIGREDDIDAVQGLLNEENTALLTLVGQGGVGKTRLALGIAQKLRTSAQEPFPDGIWFVSLAGIVPNKNATEQIADAIATAMGLSLTGADLPTQQLIRALEEQQLLLILDNFEHLVGTETFLLELVQTAQQVKLLVTSRAQLQLHAEYLYPVAGLPVPQQIDPPSDLVDDPVGGLVDETTRRRFVYLESRSHLSPKEQEDFGKYASVQLFAARVQQRLPEFRLTKQNQPNIGHICHLLGGVPLGIELTAQLYVEQGAPVLDQLIEEIKQLDPLDRPEPHTPSGLDHLQTPAIDLPERQRSIRSVFTYSWQLLNSAEQNLLRHCAIFRGGFTRDAILTVADGHSATLLGLVTKSLVRRDSHDRYDLHELVRQYVIDQFQQEPTVVNTAAQKHATYFTNLLASWQPEGEAESIFRATVQPEIENVESAWDWAIEGEQLSLLLLAIDGLVEFYEMVGRYYAAEAILKRSIEQVRAKIRAPATTQQDAPLLLTTLLATLLVKLGYVYTIGLAQLQNAEELANEALTLAEKLEDVKLTIHSYYVLSTNAFGEGNYVRAQDLAKKALQLAEEHSLQREVMIVSNTLGLAISNIEKTPSSLHYLQQALDMAQQAQDIRKTLFYRNQLGTGYRSVGDFSEALRCFKENLPATRQQNDPSQLAFAVANLGFLMLLLGEYAAAQEYLEDGVQRFVVVGEKRAESDCLALIGHLLLQQGRYADAISYCERALTLAKQNALLTAQQMAWLTLGDLYQEQQKWVEAEEAYEKCIVVCRQSDAADTMLLAQCGQAALWLGKNDAAAALSALEELLPQYAQDEFGVYFSAQRFLLLAYQILTANHDPRSIDVLQQAWRIVRNNAEKISDSRLRQSYLSNVPLHRTIGELHSQNG